MKATCIFYDRKDYPDGAIAELTIWQVPEPVLEAHTALKYSLFYGYPGQRLVGYDNERGKGDHRHIERHENPYAFTSVEALIADFVADVKSCEETYER